MKHGKKGRKFGLTRDKRKALLKNLAASLILKEKIRTTEAKAKEIRPIVEKLITKGKNNNLSAIRYLNSRLPDEARKKLVSKVSPRYKERAGGYTRIIKIEPRHTDGAKMAIIELIK